MTNAEKYLKDGVIAKELWKKFQEYYFKNKSKESDVEKSFRSFFEQPVKPTLNEDERVILKNFKESYKYIGREGTLYIAKQKKDSEFVIQVAIDEYKPDLFQFIKERRRIRDS